MFCAGTDPEEKSTEYDIISVTLKSVALLTGTINTEMKKYSPNVLFARPYWSNLITGQAADYEVY